MFVKSISLFLLSFTLAHTVKAEFAPNAMKCFDRIGNPTFIVGEFIARDGIGKEINRYDRTDFTPKFADHLYDQKLFGFRNTGPIYIDHRNIRYLNEHRTLIIGHGHKSEFLYVFKPKKESIWLEIWKLSNDERSLHITYPEDELLLKKQFECGK